MKSLYRSLLIFVMAIVLAVAFHPPLWSQTPKPTANPSAKVTAKSGTYSKIPCATLVGTSGSKAQANPTSMPAIPTFPKDAREGTDYECGYLTVPEQHSQPNGKTIQVGVAILKSTNPKPAEPLLLFQGGPGGSSISIFPQLFASPNSKEGQRLRADCDLIVFEKRGNRYSKPRLTCPELKTVADQGDAKANATAFNKALQTCRNRLTKSGVNLAAFNSLESADDVAALVKALGYKQVNLYGVSYGTELAQDVMRQHPEIVRSVILDGIVPTNPSVDSQYAVILDRLISQVDRACVNDPDCNAQYPKVKATFEETFERLNRTPASIQVFSFDAGIKEQRVTGFDLAQVLFNMAYNSGAPFVMPALIHQVHDGDFSLIAQNAYLTQLTAAASDDMSDGSDRGTWRVGLHPRLCRG